MNVKLKQIFLLKLAILDSYLDNSIVSHTALSRQPHKNEDVKMCLKLQCVVLKKIPRKVLLFVLATQLIFTLYIVVRLHNKYPYTHPRPFKKNYLNTLNT